MDSPRKKTCAPSVAARSLRLTLVRLVAYFITACALVVTYAIYASDLVDAVAVAYSLTSCVSLVFIILYGWRSQWRRTPQGRGLMALTSAFTLVGLCFSLMRVLPNFPGENTMKFLEKGSIGMDIFKKKICPNKNILHNIDIFGDVD